MEAATAPVPSVENTETAPAMTTDETVEVGATSYADGKYDSVGELEKGYTELQSAFSKKMGAFQGAPEAYEFAEGSVTEENQGLADMLGEWGLENQMSNEGINALIGKYTEFSASNREAAINDEFAKLGTDGTARVNKARTFLEANLGEDATRALGASMNTAAAIEAIEKLITMSGTTPVAPSQAESFVNKAKTEELRYAVDEHGHRKMDDPAYRAHVLKLEAALR